MIEVKIKLEPGCEDFFQKKVSPPEFFVIILRRRCFYKLMVYFLHDFTAMTQHFGER